MKTALTVSLVLIVSVSIYILTSGTAYETNFSEQKSNQLTPGPNTGDKFIIGAFNSGWDVMFKYAADTLGFNLWHIYDGNERDISGRQYPTGWIYNSHLAPNDLLFANSIEYVAQVQGVLNNVKNENMKALMMRPKIEWLCFGQRSDYQCEAGHLDPDLWFYAFNDHNVGYDTIDNSQWGNGQWVRKCLVDNNQTDGGANWVVKRLMANAEQSNPGGGFHGDSECDWLIKPRIRIDSAFANNTANFNTPVCSLTIKNQAGNTIKNVILRIKNFLIDSNNTYNGRYLEEFKYFSGDDSLKIHGKWGDDWMYSARGDNPENEASNHADIQVYWYGNCDMWIDYVRVDNDVADGLLNPNSVDYVRDSLWLQWEGSNIAGSSEAAYRFYIELFEFNNIPCMSYVSRKLAEYSGKNITLMSLPIPSFYSGHVPWSDRMRVQNMAHIKTNYMDKVGTGEIFLGSYPFNSAYRYPEEYSPQQYDTWTKIPSTLNVTLKAGILADTVSPGIYDQWLQNYLDSTPYSYESGFTLPYQRSPVENDPGGFRYTMQLGDALSKETEKPFIFNPQGHIWYCRCGVNPPNPNMGASPREITGEVQREPTNEELDLTSNLAVSYGARGLIWFEMLSYHNIPDTFYSKGIIDASPSWENMQPRYENIYGQPKWEKMRDIVQRMKTWEPYIMSFNNDDRHSYIYRLENFSCLQNEYFSSITSSYRGSEQVQCLDTPPMQIPNDGLVAECREDTYLQVSTFEKAQNDGNNYFMIVNRRCSPLDTGNHNDGERYIKVHFDNNHLQLAGGDNWKITDIASGKDTVINKNYSTHVLLLGWFQPGEGRLYKMEPVKRSGGILAGDENISGESFTCEAPVYNNGYNITIGANTTIHFNDSSKFVMNGGVFTVGDQNISAPQNITSDAVTGSSWSGHSFTNCEVKIYGATFTGLANDTTYAVNIIDCPVVDIRNSTFNTNSSLKGGVNAVFFSDPNNEITLSNIYIGANTFNSSGSTIPTVNISSYAGETTPLIIENNTFNEGNTAIFLSGITGGAIKGNAITDNFIGINALTSAIDIKSNTITSTINSAIGIFAAGGSELKMNNAGSKSLGGLNDLSNTGNTAANNIVVDGSVFLLDGGQNIFNITDDQNSKHLYGYYPQFTQGPFDETNNCFKLNSTPVDPPYNMVTSGFQGSQITFNFTPYLTGCEANDGGDGFAINLGDGIYDTIYTGGSGSGGSQSSVSSIRRTDSKIPLLRGVTAEGSQGVFVITTAKVKYDSISVLMRYRNYTQAKTKCLDLINAYPDSIQSLNAISKLFLSTVASDTSYNAVNELKIYYEDLILNHGYNTSLVKRANYYILKCKVRMREYSQALAGFQQIINQNPYSYEGLIARWDYMATSLLIQGQGGSYSNLDIDESSSIDAVNALQREAHDDDRSPFTKEQRQDIRKSINTAIEISKDEDDRKIKTLEIKSEQGDVNASKELEQIRSLKQVVKTEKPKSINEHVRIVSEDIRKEFGSNTGSKGNEPKNIPIVFRLSQNYPNPFNPVTKINYDLPRDSKVKKVIYDILGREVKRLVNNELKTAGFYIVDFNASNYASGVYFYRIEAEEPNGNKFVDSKKMILLK